MIRESSKMQAFGQGSFGIYSQELAELFLIQHVHYMQGSRSDAAPHPGTAHLVQPFEITQLAPSNGSNAASIQAASADDAARMNDITQSDDHTHSHDSTLARMRNVRMIVFPSIAFTLQQCLSSEVTLRPALVITWCQQLLLALDHMIGWSVPTITRCLCVTSDELWLQQRCLLEMD